MGIEVSRFNSNRENYRQKQHVNMSAIVTTETHNRRLSFSAERLPTSSNGTEEVSFQCNVEFSPPYYREIN